MWGVRPEFRGDEALDACFRRGLDEEKLGFDDGGAEGGDDGILALEGGGERVKGVVFDGFDGDGRGEVVGAGFAREDCDLEAGGEESVEDGGAEVAGTLREGVVLVSWGGWGV